MYSNPPFSSLSLNTVINLVYFPMFQSLMRIFIWFVVIEITAEPMRKPGQSAIVWQEICWVNKWELMAVRLLSKV